MKISWHFLSVKNQSFQNVIKNSLHKCGTEKGNLDAVFTVLRMFLLFWFYWGVGSCQLLPFRINRLGEFIILLYYIHINFKDFSFKNGSFVCYHSSLVQIFLYYFFFRLRSLTPNVLLRAIRIHNPTFRGNYQQVLKKRRSIEAIR